MPMYNLIEYSDNYADSSGSLYQFKRDESPTNDDGNPNNVALDNSTSFKYKASILVKIDDADGNDRSLKNIKLVVPLIYLSNFFRSLEMPLIDYKIHLEFNWNKNNCVMYGADTYAGGDNTNAREATFQIITTNLYVPVIALSSKDNLNLTKHIDEGFKRSVYWNEYKSKIETKVADNNNVTRFPLDASFQGVNRLFVLAFDNTDGNKHVERDSHRKYFSPRVNMTSCNVLIDGRNFYDQLINNHQIKKYDEIRKIATGKGDDYITGYSFARLSIL